MRAALWPCWSLAVLAGAAGAADAGGQVVPVATATNPAPDRLPTLSVWNDSAFAPGRTLTMLRASFPNVPEFTCESWCYESPVTFVDARALSGGGLELRHRVDATPQVLWITTATPEEGAVDLSVRLALDPARQPAGELPAPAFTPNLCWQLRRAPLFASQPEPYPKFVQRCFLFTPAGRTFMDHTDRRKIPCRKLDDPYNNPPWVQMYVGTWLAIPGVNEKSWANYSPDQYTTPIVGTVSRDGRFLAALANESAGTFAQAWHDCLHNNPAWTPTTAAPADRRWRLRMYVMANDPDALLARVVKDLPGARPREK